MPIRLVHWFTPSQDLQEPAQPVTPGPPGPPGPQGATGSQGIQGNTGPMPTPGTPAVYGAIAFATAYQALDPSKHCVLSVMAQTTYTVTRGGTLADEIELRKGPDATVASGGGHLAATARWSLTGIALSIGMAMADRRQLTALLPLGWYWAVRRVTGTTAVVTSAHAQPFG